MQKWHTSLRILFLLMYLAAQNFLKCVVWHLPGEYILHKTMSSKSNNQGRAYEFACLFAVKHSRISSTIDFANLLSAA